MFRYRIKITSSDELEEHFLHKQNGMSIARMNVATKSPLKRRVISLPQLAHNSQSLSK
jgi:hypothetical protein